MPLFQNNPTDPTAQTNAQTQEEDYQRAQTAIQTQQFFQNTQKAALNAGYHPGAAPTVAKWPEQPLDFGHPIANNIYSILANRGRK